MKRNTLVLIGLVVVLWGAWYAFHSEEKSALSVRERHDFFKADSTAVDSIDVRYATWTHLAKRGGKWTVIFPEWEQNADPHILRDVFKFTNEMVLENLISTKPAKQESFQVDTMRGTVMRFFVSGTPVAEFVMGKAGADMNHTYIRQLNSDSVYLARGDFQRVFRRVPTDWGSRILFDVDSSEVRSIRWITKDGETRIARDGSGTWLVYSDSNSQGLPVDTSALNLRLRLLCPTTIDTYASNGTGVSAETDNPYMQMILDTKDGRADTTLWNHPSDADVRMFGFRPGRPKPLFIIDKKSFERFRGTFKDLVSKEGSKRIDEHSSR